MHNSNFIPVPKALNNYDIMSVCPGWSDYNLSGDSIIQIGKSL